MNGNNIFSKILIIIEIINLIIFEKNLTIYLLKNLKYIKIPKNKPTNIYIRSSPVVYRITVYNKIIADIIQNNISSKYVIILGNFQTLLLILKISNKILIIIPDIANIANILNWLIIISFKLKVLSI